MPSSVWSRTNTQFFQGLPTVYVFADVMRTLGILTACCRGAAPDRGLEEKNHPMSPPGLYILYDGWLNTAATPQRRGQSERDRTAHRAEPPRDDDCGPRGRGGCDGAPGMGERRARSGDRKISVAPE